MRMMRKMRKTILRAVLFVWLVIAFYPLVWMVYTGLKAEREVTANVWALPSDPQWGNLSSAWRAGGFRRAYLNSAIVCTAAGAAAVLFASAAAFAFARLRFRGKEALFYLFLIGMMIPVHVTLIPLHRLLAALHLRSTYVALIGPYTGFALPISIFILRGFFEQVPRELEDAARIDGCSSWGVFRHVALPMARPALATVIVFNFVTMWNEFVFALTFISDPKLQTLPLALYQFSDQAGIFIARTCAALTLGVLPLLLVYFIAQKHIIRGLTAGALKQ